MNKNYLIGSDPEAFLYDPREEKIISAIGIIPGSKYKPYTPKDLAPGFGLQTDNILVEFNIPPIQTEGQLLSNMNTMKDYIHDYLRKRDYGVEMQYKASAIVTMDQLMGEGAMTFGCDPDFSCYTGRTNPAPSQENPFLRSAGCHWHIGYNAPTLNKSLQLVKYMDLFLGVPSILIDKDTDRRQLYGKAGSYRLQKWGVEYRTLSSRFIKNDATLKFCYKQIEKSIDAFENNYDLPEKEVIFEIINNNNVDLAKEIIKVFKIL